MIEKREEAMKLALKTPSETAEEDVMPLPCATPGDLYSYTARMTMARLLEGWLAAQRLTVTELIHNASALEKFEAAGVTYQHAIQKIAVAGAAKSKFPVTKIIKQLNDLCTAAIHRVYKDDRRGLFPLLDTAQFAQLAEQLTDPLGARYVLNGALSKYLAPATSWDAKLRLMLALIESVTKEERAGALLLSAIDSLIAELLSSKAALVDLLGPQPDCGQALMNFVQLFHGATLEPTEGLSETVNRLARYFAKDELPVARDAIAEHILAALKGAKRLCSVSFESELKLFHQLIHELRHGQPTHLDHDDLTIALNQRSKQLVTEERLLQFLSTAKTLDEKMECILVVEECVVGTETKRTLASYIIALLSSNNADEQIAPNAPCVRRLKRLADLQKRVLRSGFQDVQQNQISVTLDAIAARIELRTQFLARLETSLTNPVERAQTILKLCSAGVFTQGTLAAKARRASLATTTNVALHEAN